MYTTAVHQSTNGMAERMVAFVKNAIYAYIDEGHSNWCEILPFIEFAYRTTVVEGLKFSPFKMLYARDPVLPLDMLYREPIPRRHTKREYHEQLLANFQQIYRKARGSQLQIDEKKARLYNRKQIAVQFSIGDWILVWTPPSHKRGRTTKLMARFSGPYKVLERLSDLNYRIKHRDTDRVQIVHVQRMIHFHARALENEAADSPIIPLPSSNPENPQSCPPRDDVPVINPPSHPHPNTNPQSTSKSDSGQDLADQSNPHPDLPEAEILEEEFSYPAPDGSLTIFSKERRDDGVWYWVETDDGIRSWIPFMTMPQNIRTGFDRAEREYRRRMRGNRN